MTSSKGNIFRVTGILWGVNSPHKGQWEILRFVWFLPEQTLMVEQTIKTQMIWDAIAPIMTSL